MLFALFSLSIANHQGMDFVSLISFGAVSISHSKCPRCRRKLQIRRITSHSPHHTAEMRRANSSFARHFSTFFFSSAPLLYRLFGRCNRSWTGDVILQLPKFSFGLPAFFFVYFSARHMESSDWVFVCTVEKKSRSVGPPKMEKNKRTETRPERSAESCEKNILSTNFYFYHSFNAREIKFSF